MKSADLASLLGPRTLPVSGPVGIDGHDGSWNSEILSKSGLLLRGSPLPADEEFTLVFRALDRNIAAVGRVAWSENTSDPHGSSSEFSMSAGTRPESAGWAQCLIGIEFTCLGDDDANAIDQALLESVEASSVVEISNEGFPDGFDKRGRTVKLSEHAAVPLGPVPGAPVEHNGSKLPEHSLALGPSCFDLSVNTTSPDILPRADVPAARDSTPNSDAVSETSQQRGFLGNTGLLRLKSLTQSARLSRMETLTGPESLKRSRYFTPRTIAAGVVALVCAGIVIAVVASRSGHSLRVRAGTQKAEQQFGKKERLSWSCASSKGPRPVSAGGLACIAFSSSAVHVRRKEMEAWAELHVANSLFEGDQVRTPSTSRVRVQLDSGAVIELQPDSSFQIDAATEQPAGAPRGRLIVLSGAASVKPGAVAQPVFRGADKGDLRLENAGKADDFEYRVTALVAGKMEVSVRKGQGRLVVGSRGGQRVVALNAGRAQDLKDGELAGGVQVLPAFPMLLKPGIDATVEVTAAQKIELAWQKVPAVDSYRIEVALDQGFSSLLVSGTTKEATFVFEATGPGVVYWRVASRNPAGRYGEFGFSRRLFVVSAEDLEYLLVPDDGTILAFDVQPPPVTFCWKAAVTAVPYKLVISKKPDLSGKLVVERRTKLHELSLQLPEAGIYYWGVYLDNPGNPKPLFKRSRRLDLKLERSARVPRRLQWEFKTSRSTRTTTP